MSLGRLVCEDDAVSPVVGVTLLVVITVLLVAAILAVLGGVAGETPSQTEVDVQQSAFSFELAQNKTYSTPNLDGSCPGDGSCLAGANDEYIGDRLTVTYESGADIPAEDIRIRATGVKMKILNESGYLEDYGNGHYHSNYTLSKATDESTVTASDEFVLVTNYGDYAKNSPPYTPGGLLREASITVIYEGDERSVIMAEWDGPKA